MPGAMTVLIHVWPVLKSLPQIGSRFCCASAIIAGTSTERFGAPFANGTSSISAA